MVSVKILSMSAHKLMYSIHCEMILSLALPSVEVPSFDHITSQKWRDSTSSGAAALGGTICTKTTAGTAGFAWLPAPT